MRLIGETLSSMKAGVVETPSAAEAFFGDVDEASACADVAAVFKFPQMHV